MIRAPVHRRRHGQARVRRRGGLALRLVAVGRRLRRRDRDARRVLERSTSAPTSTKSNLSQARRRSSRPRSRSTPCRTRPTTGYLRQIVPAADRQKATVRVKVAFLDADDKILPDLSARVSFTAEPTQGKAGRSRVLIPKAAAGDASTGRPASSASSRDARSSSRSRRAETCRDRSRVTKGLQGGETSDLARPAGRDPGRRPGPGRRREASGMSERADRDRLTSKRSTTGTRSRSRS